MENVWNTKIQVELTLRELEEVIVMLRVANKVVSGDVRSEIEEKLANIATSTKMSID